MMKITKVLAIHAMALFSLQGGRDVGLGLAAAGVVAALEGEDGRVATDEPLVPRGGDTDVRLDSKAEGRRHGKPKALGAIAKLIGSLRAGVAEDADAVGDDFGGAAKLRGAVVDDGAAGEVAEKTGRFQDLKGGMLADDAEIGEEHSAGKDTEKIVVGGISEATAVFLAEYERAQDEYAHTWAKNALFQMRDDYAASSLNEDPDIVLSSFEKVKSIYMKMYESFHPRPEQLEVVSDDNSTDLPLDPDAIPPSSWVNITWDNETHISNATISYNDTDSLHNYTWTNYTSQFNITDANRTKGVDMSNYTEDEALLFINGRMTENSWSSTFQEVMVCKDMFTNEENGLNISEDELMNLTLSDMDIVAQTCYSDLVSTNLEALGYNPETFCPLLATILPLQFQVLGEVITQNLTSFCSFLVDTTFESAGEPECYRRMEEVVLTDTIRQGARYSFPNIVHTSTFDNSYLTICTRNRDPFNYDLDNCTSSLAAVKEVSIDYDGNETMISYMSNLCDAFGLPVPHPNETIRARFLDQHVHHKPGGKPNIKIRHMMSDLFNYVGHYKHGFKNKYGHDIEHPTDTLLDPEHDEFLSTGDWDCDENANKLSPGMTCEQRNLYCTGLAFSVGAGGSGSAGPMTVGGGVDFGFGIQDDEGKKYEETFVWGICGTDALPLPINAVDDAKAEAKKSETRQKMEDSDVGVSVGISAGGWTNTGHIPGFAETYTVTITILVVDVGFTIVLTYADAWQTCNGAHGFLLEVGASFPPNGPLNVDLDQMKCYGETIVSADDANPKFPRVYDINMTARWHEELCGPNTYSFNIENTGTSGSETETGLSLYYYKTEEDWNNQRNQVWIVHYCGDPVLGPNHKKITTMGHGDHVTVSQIYGVGIAAHGDDAYKLGTASLWQTVGGNKWIQKFVADGLDLCISTNDPGCYPNVEIRIQGPGMPKQGTGNNEIEWRSGNKRVPASRHCVVKSQKYFAEYSQNIPIKDWEYDYNCGGDMTMTFNPYGSWNSDKIEGIDEKEACESCAAQLKTDGYISSGSCFKWGGTTWKVSYTPKKTYRTVRKCNPEKCTSSYKYCYVGGRREKVWINRDGAWHSDIVWDIPDFWSWEDSAKKCCKYLQDAGVVSSCGSHWNKGPGINMYMKYKATRSCTQECWNESVETGCGLKYNIGCGGAMSLQRYERCQSNGEDTVSKLWEGGCAECGDNLVSRGKIRSGYMCESDGLSMQLKYDPIEQYEIKKTPVSMLWDSTPGWHSNTIDSIKDGFSWEEACAHAKRSLEDEGYIHTGAYCETNGVDFYGTTTGATSIWLNYRPKDDWYPISSNSGQNLLDMSKDCALVKIAIDFDNNHSSSGTSNELCVLFPGQAEKCKVPGTVEQSNWMLTTDLDRLCKDQEFTITNKGGDAFLADQFKVIGKDNKFTAYVGGNNNAGWCLSQDRGDYSAFGSKAYQGKCCASITIKATTINENGASLSWAWAGC